MFLFFLFFFVSCFLFVISHSFFFSSLVFPFFLSHLFVFLFFFPSFSPSFPLYILLFWFLYVIFFLFFFGPPVASPASQAATPQPEQAPVPARPCCRARSSVTNETARSLSTTSDSLSMPGIVRIVFRVCTSVSRTTNIDSCWLVRLERTSL